jgi:copper chaperone CopZ
MKVTIKVNNMMCEKCQKKIIEGLENHDIECGVNLANKEVIVEDKDKEAAIKIITKLGYKTL